jgi:hypothetical protein
MGTLVAASHVSQAIRFWKGADGADDPEISPVRLVK